MAKTRRFCFGTTTSLALSIACLGPSLPGLSAASEAAPVHAPNQRAGLCHDDPSRTPSTLTYLACGLKDGLPPLSRETIVVARPLSEGSSEGGSAFARRLSLLLSNATSTRDGGVALGPNPQPGPDAVLLLEPQLHGTLVQVNATLLGKRAGVWARLRGETHQVLAHAFASQPLDTELRSYLPALPLVRPTIATYSTPLSQINAIACGDIDADGALEVAVANRRDVAWGTLSEKGFSAIQVATWSALSDVSPVPLREPLAALLFNGTTLEASTTDRLHWLRLDAALAPVDKRPYLWGIAPGLCVERKTNAWQRIFDCQHPPGPSETTSTSFDRVVALGADRAPRVFAWRDPETTALTVRTPTRTWNLGERGAQLSLGDLNHDGTLELVSSSATLDRKKDAIAVHSLPDTAQEPVLLWELPVPTGVDALAVCPSDAHTQGALLFASNDRVGVAL